MPRGRARSKEEIGRILRQFEASGQSVRAFARKHGLAVSTLDLYRRKWTSEQAEGPTLRRVSVIGGASSEAFEIQVPGGTVLRVPVGAPAASMETLIPLFLSSCSR